jgi:hypothetical protein
LEKKQKCVFLGNSLMSDKRCMMGDIYVMCYYIV